MADMHEGTRTTADAERRTSGPRDPTPPAMDVRDEDLEPHAGIRYIARLFKLLALLLVLLLIGEVIINLVRQGADAVPFLLIEATRLIVFAGLLWGAGDIALMLIESNHDLRATRILVGRMNARVQRMEEAAGIHPPRFGGAASAAPPAAAPPPPSPPPVGEHGEL